MIARIINTLRWADENRKKSGKSLLWIILDFIKLKRKYKISKLEYSNYKLHSADNNFRETFLPFDEAMYYWNILNPREYACLARNKYLSNCLLKRLDIPTADIIAYYNPTLAAIGTEYAYDYNSLVHILKQKKVKNFVVKPAEDSAHGQGVFVCYNLKFDDAGECVIELYGGKNIKLRDILSSSPLLFESLIEQNAQMMSFNSTSVNTMRIMTALYPDNKVGLIAAFLKIGRKGSDVDNAGSGGNVDCGIDIRSGKLYNPVQFNSWDDVVNISQHPDTGIQLSETFIKDWGKIIAQVKDFQARIPFLKVIGWDVALTDNGPVIVEINNRWDTTGQLFIQRGWTPEVKDCYEAWVKYYKTTH